MMKKIVFLAPHLSTGGMPQYLLKQIESLIEVYDVYCIEWSNVTGGKLVVQRNRIESILGKKLITLPENKIQILSIIESIQPDIVHLQEIPEYFMPYEIAHKLYNNDRNFKIIETSHDSSFNVESKVHFPDKFMMVSNWQVKNFKKLGIPTELVEYPIEYKTRVKDKNILLKELGLDPNLKHVINVGLFTPRKNQAEVIEYAKMLKDYPIQFHFIGNQADNFKDYWEPIMSEFPQNCKWWGERNDVDTFYQIADLFLFTSRGHNSDKETMPLVIREAISWSAPSLIYNLDVYENYFDEYKNINYLDIFSLDKNKQKILNILNINNANNLLFYTLHGQENLTSIEYPNSTYETLIKHGDAAAQYFATFILKELEQGDFKIQKDGVFVDLGANIGMSSYYAKLMGAKEIISFEPDPNLIEIIKKNVPEAKVHRYAISDKCDSIELYHWPFNPVNVGPKYNVLCIDLKEVLKLVNKKIDYLKIDIEGFEENIFDNLTEKELQLLDRVYIEHHNPDTAQNFIEKLNSKGFDTIVNYGLGQACIYATYNMESAKNYQFDSEWNADEQKIYYWCQKNVNCPIIVSLKEYQSDAVLWATTYENLIANIQYWMIPISKEYIDYDKDENFTGIKFCIYNKITGEQLYEKPFYKRFVNKPSVRLSNFVPYYVNYEEFFIKHKYQKWLKNNYNLVVDVGANVGVFSEYMLHNNYANSIVAVECDPIAITDLNKNFKFNNRIKIISKALSYSNTPIKFYHSEENPVISSVLSPDKLEYHIAGVKGQTQITVETITIGDLIKEYGNIDLLKIDIEGAEYDIISHFENHWSNSINRLLIECHFFENDYMQKYEALIEKLKSVGYTVEEFVANQSSNKSTSESIFAYKK
jgi:FkbM family methyltransferase